MIIIEYMNMTYFKFNKGGSNVGFNTSDEGIIR